MFRRFEIEAARASVVRCTRLPTTEMAALPPFEALLALWQRKRGARPAPARSDLDPAEFGGLLPDLLLIDVHYAPPDFRYRLAGTRTRDIHGVELTGRSVLDISPPEQGRLLWNDLCEMLETWQPQHVRLDFLNSRNQSRSYQVLRLPLSETGTRVDKVMVIQNFGSQMEQIREFYSGLRRPAG